MEKIIHQIWVGPFPMSRRCAVEAQRIRAEHPDFDYRFWTDSNLPDMADNIQMAFNSWMSKKSYAFAADVLRIWVVYLYGGIYLDVDFVCLAGLSGLHLDRHEVFLCSHEGVDKTFPNGVFGMAKGSALAQAAVNAIQPTSHWHGPSWFGAVVRSFLGVPEEVTPEELVPIMAARGWLSVNFYNDFDKNYLHHDALASWFPENQQKFIDGTIDIDV